MAARKVNDPVWARDNQGMNVYRQARIVRVLDPVDGVPRRYEVRWCDGDKLSKIYPVPFICTEANFDPRDSRGRAGRAARRGAASTRPEAARHSTAGVDDDYPPANAHAESSEEDRPAPAIAPAESSAESVAEQHHQTVAVANAESTAIYIIIQMSSVVTRPLSNLLFIHLNSKIIGFSWTLHEPIVRFEHPPPSFLYSLCFQPAL